MDNKERFCKDCKYFPEGLLSLSLGLTIPCSHPKAEIKRHDLVTGIEKLSSRKDCASLRYGMNSTEEITNCALGAIWFEPRNV